MNRADANALSLVLSEIERKLLDECYKHVDGDVSEPILGPELYAIGYKLGLSEDDIHRHSISLKNRGLVKAEPVFGRKIAAIKLTNDGADFLVLTRC
jgi:hypothetical protein